MSIQAAIDAARPGDTIVVGPGEYRMTRPLEFRDTGLEESPPKELRVRSARGPEATMIRRVGDGPVVRFRSGEGRGSVLEGFTIAGGRDSGVRCEDASPTIRNCVITENWGHTGGGLYCKSASPLLVACAIFHNAAAFAGGGIHCDEGGAPVLESCGIRENVTELIGTGGGGVSLSDATLVLRDSRVTGNASYFGGGMIAFRSEITLERTVVAGNLAEINGGGFSLSDSTVSLLRCSVYANRTRSSNARGPTAGALFAEDSELRLLGCTVAQNSAVEVRDQRVTSGLQLESSSAELTNCIVWDHRRRSIDADESSRLTVSYSCVQGPEVIPGDRNQNQDPLFQSAGRVRFSRLPPQDFFGTMRVLPDFIAVTPNYSLQPTSPCVDAGAPTPQSLLGFRHSEAPCGTGVDLGAHETGRCGVRFRRGDVDGDGRVALTDSVRILEHLYVGSVLTCRKAADCDDSGKLSLTDPVALLGFLFLGGNSPPPPPFEDCGEDPTPDSLDCGSALGCSPALGQL